MAPSLSRIACLNDSYTWPRVYCETPEISCRLRHMHSSLSSLRLCTAFSGVCTPSVALESLSATIPTLIGATCDSVSNVEWEYLSSCEWADSCQIELQCLPRSPTCRYESIYDFVSPAAQQAVSDLGDSATWDQLKHIILKHTSINLEAWCCNHNAYCAHPTPSLMIAGTPCIDFSSLGSTM